MNPLPAYIDNSVQSIFADDNRVNIQQHEWEMRAFLALAVEVRTFRGVRRSQRMNGWTRRALRPS